VFQECHRALNPEEMPPLLLPRKGRYGLKDYERVFCSELNSATNIFDMRGVDRERGCVIVVRPDQYVAHILPLDAYAELTSFFEGFMLPQN
jgi:phenol 2-monooxygenase